MFSDDYYLESLEDGPQWDIMAFSDDGKALFECNLCDKLFSLIHDPEHKYCPDCYGQEFLVGPQS